MKTLKEILEALPSNIRTPIYEALLKLKEDIFTATYKGVEERLAKLEHAVTELVEAQRSTERTLAELIEAQKKNELHLAELEKAINELTEAQKVNELRFTELEKAVKELAEVQKRNELRFAGLEKTINKLTEAQKRNELRFVELEKAVKELTEAQIRTEERVRELAQAQKKTEEEIKLLAEGLSGVRQEVGGLSRTISYAFENEAFRMLPKVLKEKYNVELKEKFIRAEIGGKEINIFGKGKKDGEDVLIVGEAKLRISEWREFGEVCGKLNEKVNAVLKEYGEQNIIKIIVTHFARTRFVEEARKENIIVIQSFEW